MECYTHLRNVTDLLSDGKTPKERRFGKSFEGPIIPCGSLVEYHPTTAKDQSRMQTLRLETSDASEICSKRLNAKEVMFPKQGEFVFPIADGRIKIFGGDQELRTSTLVRHRPIQGESNIDFLGESEGSLPQPQD